MPEQRRPVTGFCSYSHIDDALREQLDRHLASLKREGLIDVWHDRRIPPGAEWKGQIGQDLEAAELILLLVSADFLHSDYCTDIEARLLRAIRKLRPDLPQDQPLEPTLRRVVDTAAADGRPKVLFVLDQFEQWLHVHRADLEPELVRALRVCDGSHLQCLLVVRPEFQVDISGSSGFMGDARK